MEFGNHTAEVLVEALPYIKKFYGTTIVIKYGGHAMVDKEMREKVISDIVLMRFVGMNPILVCTAVGRISIISWKRKTTRANLSTACA